MTWQAGEGLQLEGGVPAKAGAPPTRPASSSAGVWTAPGIFPSRRPLCPWQSIPLCVSACAGLAETLHLSVANRYMCRSVSSHTMPEKLPPLLQDMPSSNGVAAKAEAEQPHHSLAQPDAAVPMEVETAKAENAQEQSRILEQQSMPMQESLPGNEAEEQYQRTDVPVELPASAASGPAHKPDRALAEQAANTTLAALNGGAAAHPTTADAEHAATPSLPMEADMPMAAQAADDILAEPHAVSAAPVGSDAVIIAQNGNASEMGSAGS